MDGVAVDSIAVTLELHQGSVHLPDAVCYMMPYGEQCVGPCIGAFRLPLWLLSTCRPSVSFSPQLCNPPLAVPAEHSSNQKVPRYCSVCLCQSPPPPSWSSRPVWAEIRGVGQARSLYVTPPPEAPDPPRVFITSRGQCFQGKKSRLTRGWS